MHLYRSLFALVLLVSVNAYRILLVYPLPLRSLNKLGEGFARHLLNAGHEVTFVTHYPVKTVTDNLRQIDLSSNIVEMSDNYTFTIRSVMNSEAVVNDVKVLQDYAIINSIASLGHKNFKELLEDTNQSFDAVLVDYYEIEIYASIASLYDCPMIWATSMGPHWQALRLIDQPSNPAYTADYLSSNNAPFTFRQRVEELWAQIKWNWLKWTYTLPKEKETFENIFRPLFEKRGKSLPDYNTLLYNVSLMFSNDHSTFGGVPSIPQSMKLIGGYHIEHPPKPLPKDLQQLMDNAKHGVIYFSMGSIWRSKDFPKSTIEDLLKVFGKLQQIVIWKFEDDLSNVPANVKIMKWAPQPSILYHPNCVVFVTHGGLLSSTESIHFGVPIIGIPIFFDQFLNINKAASNGYAIRVPLNYELPKNLEVAIQTMLSDPKYKKLAKDFSSIYHHRPLPPGKEAVHWIEHVIKTGGAIHLRSPALNVPFYQKFYLDLTAILFFIIFMFSKIVKVMLSRKYSDLKGIKEKNN
ncbi:unnamed protein product [Diatraea saccharalis]|uniref:UDP-glucuronosyltransferase n=1 Tax=Diatraea saccharalis TaxID=40085 RepID=A0A9N9WHT6_9NEOP|nr:unnamed protein product [Diatraea saccharalis]